MLSHSLLPSQVPLVDKVKRRLNNAGMTSELWQRIRAVRKHMRLTQEEFGGLFDVSKAAVSQWESKSDKHRTQPVTDTLKKMASLSTAPIEWLLNDSSNCDAEFWQIDDESNNIVQFPNLVATGSVQNNALAQANQTQSAIESDSLRPILVWEHPDELPEGEYVFVPRLNIQLSTGHGREQIDVDLIKDKPQAFRADWIRELRLKPAGLASMRVTGDSMEPRLYSGDAVVVDTADTEVLDGKAYALWYDGGERIKRLFRLPGGGVRIVSDNRDKYPSIDLSADQCQHVRIIGRVRHVASTRGL